MPEPTQTGAIASLSDDDLLQRVRLQFRVEQFYYEEAAALDERRYEDWLALFSDRVHYWMPIRRTVVNRDIDSEFTQPGTIAYFDDDKSILTARVKKLRTGFSWSEDPPSRTRHLITNIRVLEDGGKTLRVTSNFHLYRTRLDSEEDNWIGRREDTLEKLERTFLIAERKIYLEQTVLLAKNLSSFF